MARRKALDFEQEPQQAIPGMQPEEPQTRAKRISIPLRDDGTLDVENMRDSSREKLFHALEQDPSALVQFGGSAPSGAAPGAPVGDVITADHVNFILTGYEYIEKLVIPPILSKQNGNQKVPIQIVERVFRFTPEQREQLVPHGVRFFNDNLPSWIKEWISRAGPGSQFFGGIALITWTQTQMVMQLWRESLSAPGAVEGQFKTVEPEQPVNGQQVVENVTV